MKNNKCFVDSSALIALNNPKDPYHQTAIEIAHQLNQRQLVVSDAVLMETYTFSRYQSGYRVASNFLKIVLGGPSFIIAESRLQLEWQRCLYSDNSENIKFHIAKIGSAAC